MPKNTPFIPKLTFYWGYPYICPDIRVKYSLAGELPEIIHPTDSSDDYARIHQLLETFFIRRNINHSRNQHHHHHPDREEYQVTYPEACRVCHFLQRMWALCSVVWLAEVGDQT